MNFEGSLKKDEKFKMLVAEIPAFDVMTQGDSVEQTLEMIKGIINELLLDTFSEKAKEMKLETAHVSDEGFELRSNNTKLLISLALRRQREAAGLTIKEVAERLGASSINYYAQYERGRISISIEMLEKLLVAVNPKSPRRLKIV